MKTVEVALYEYADLLLPENENVKKAVINEWISKGRSDTSYIYQEAKKTVEAFCGLTNVRTGNKSWLDAYTMHIDDSIAEMKGLRLRTWFINNYQFLWEGKYFSLWSKTEKSFKYYKDGYPVLKYRYSKVIQVKKNCNLTGACYDESLLAPIYSFIEKPNGKTFAQVINECFDNLRADVESECEHTDSEEYIMNEISANNYVFEEDGSQF